ncbi:LacI family DNA-binding transcriptional regulator [Deinococcus roseus]|uniref:LacI family transcriptional regulator n=1 Tax=Deinococcus roseus TaxID=392414 RepID=A0ABQ2D584_9DEIO|nr:LacI family DNA-binding transcriptional regulator [Deinococcus roseus]GGJ43322.1 LacI family transcriptional regulator [Deinococcus roseus]
MTRKRVSIPTPAPEPTPAPSIPRKPTMQDVANVAGVSLKTVSRVVNNEPNVESATAARVQAAIQEMGFRRNEIARSLRPGQTTSTLGLVTEDISNPFYSSLARGIEEVARGRGCLVIAGSSEEDALREKELVNTLLQRSVDGLLVVPAAGDHTYLNAQRISEPVVFMDRPPEGIQADMVLLDNRGGAYQAVEHLIARGHSRIAFVDGHPYVHTGLERMNGYRQALAAANITYDRSLVVVGCHDPQQAEQATLNLLKLPNPPTAIFATNNRLSIGVLKGLTSSGKWLDLAGFDDFELADMLPFEVTVVRYDTIQMGRVAAEMLFARLDGDTSPPQTRIIEVEVVVRGPGRVGLPSGY